VEFDDYTGTLALTPGTYVQNINALLWTINYTYNGTDNIASNDSPSGGDWPALSFNIAAPRNIYMGEASGTLNQTGLLVTNWVNDYISFSNGQTTSLWLYDELYRVDVTPLGYGTIGAGPSLGLQTLASPYITARFEVTAIPEPVSMVMLGCLGAGMAAARKLRRQKS
jgi:hypothetical protein